MGTAPTTAALRAAGVTPAAATAFLPHVVAACARFAIDTPSRIAAFVGQASHESGGFVRLEENLFYTTPSRIREVWPSRFASTAEAAGYIRNPQKLANRVYAGRNGNGTESSGDGGRFIGRGLFQLTGRNNYQAAGDALGIPCVLRPEMVAMPEYAALTAAWYWASIGGNELADRGDHDTITRRINGRAMLGHHERVAHAAAALQVLTA